MEEVDAVHAQPFERALELAAQPSAVVPTGSSIRWGSAKRMPPNAMTEVFLFVLP